MSTMLSVKHVYKVFGFLDAVSDVSFELNKGKMVGLIGPDGAGKTTLMRMICSLMIPDKGDIYVSNLNTVKDRMAVRKMIGYMPQKFSLYPDLTVEQNIAFFADLFDVKSSEYQKRVNELYQFSRLEPFKKRKAGALSGGMKQKLALSCNLIHSPKMLILDEPTFGVDPLSRQEFWELIRNINQEGTTILVSTPYMDEAEQFDELILMFKGKIINQGTLPEIKKVFPYQMYSMEFENSHSEKDLKLVNNPVQSVHYFGNRAHISFLDAVPEDKWTDWSENGFINNARPEKPTLEDIFLYYIGADHE